jgi:hypothetical protein
MWPTPSPSNTLPKVLSPTEQLSQLGVLALEAITILCVFFTLGSVLYFSYGNTFHKTPFTQLVPLKPL